MQPPAAAARARRLGRARVDVLRGAVGRQADVHGAGTSIARTPACASASAGEFAGGVGAALETSMTYRRSNDASRSAPPARSTLSLSVEVHRRRGDRERGEASGRRRPAAGCGGAVHRTTRLLRPRARAALGGALARASRCAMCGRTAHTRQRARPWRRAASAGLVVLGRVEHQIERVTSTMASRSPRARASPTRRARASPRSRGSPARRPSRVRCPRRRPRRRGRRGARGRGPAPPGNPGTKADKGGGDGVDHDADEASAAAR